MTKEPIMIDDVDVSECDFFSSGLGYCTIGLLANDGTHICECEQNCHYKQLKRKEQECEELKKSVRSNKDKRKKAIERYLKLKEFTNKEFEKLKAENKELKEKVNSYICSTNCYKHKENDKYRQALQEIKEVIIEFSKQDIITFPDFEPKKNYKLIQQQFREPIVEILQKCEVINEQN